MSEKVTEELCDKEKIKNKGRKGNPRIFSKQ